MGGLRRQLPRNEPDVPDRLARAGRHPAARRLLVEGRDPRLGARRRAARSACSSSSPASSARCSRASTSFRLYFKVFHGPEPRTLVAQHATEHGSDVRTARARARCSSRSAILTFFTVVGGLLNIPGAWHLFGDWLEGVVPPLVEPSTAEDYVTSLLAVALGATGIWIAWRRFVGGRELVPWRAPRRLLEHKLYFDELYDAVFYRPAAARARRSCARAFDEPVVEGSLPIVGAGHGEAARALAASRRASSAPTPSPSRLPSPSSSSSSWRCADVVTTWLIVLPLAGALAVWLLPVSREWTSGIALLVAVAEIGLWAGHDPELRLRRRAAVRAAALLVLRPRRLLPRRHVPVLVLADRADGRLLRGRDRLRLLDRSRAPARVLRPDALPARAPSSESSARRICCSSTSSSR